jgi:anti-anti-sigma factor
LGGLGLAVDVIGEEGLAHTVLVSGEVDLVSSGMLRETLEMMSRGGGDVTVDLADVTFADTTLGYALVDFQQEWSCRGEQLRIVNIPPRVRRMLVLGKFAERLELPDERGRVASTALL